MFSRIVSCSGNEPPQQPAVNWLRLASASVPLASSQLLPIALTWGEHARRLRSKVRHSREGRTQGLQDKWMQMGLCQCGALQEWP